MAKLKDETHVLMDGAVKVYRRPNTRRWQATFQIGGVWVRVSTAQGDLEDAKRVAREQYLDYKFREKHGLPVLTKRFEDVANLAIHDMQRQPDHRPMRASGAGSPSTTICGPTPPMVDSRPPWSTSMQSKPVSRCRQ